MEKNTNIIGSDNDQYEKLLKTLDYANMGWSMLPIKPETKRPPIYWKEFQTRCASSQEIESWFCSFLDIDIAVVCGKVSGIIVVDCDDPKAVDWIEQWNLPVTLTESTSKGKHYYFKYNEALGNINLRYYLNYKDDNLPIAVEIKTNGSLVVCAPSKNKKWLAQPCIENIAELPADFIKMILDLEKPAKKKVENIVADVEPKSDAELKLDKTTVRAENPHYFASTKEEALVQFGLLCLWFSRSQEGSCYHNNGYVCGIAQKWVDCGWLRYVDARDGLIRATELFNDPQKAVVCIDALLIPPPQNDSEYEEEKKKGYSLEDFKRIEPKKNRWLVNDLFLTGEINGLYADSDLGKTSLLLHMATFIGLGKQEFLGKQAFDGIDGAIFLASEDSFEDAQVRVLNFLGFEEPPNVDSRFRFFPIEEIEGDVITMLNKFLVSRPNWVVFVDTYSDFFSGDDMKSKLQSAQYMASWRKITRQYKATVVLSHHINKSSRDKTAHKNNATESKAFTDGCRVAVELQERFENSSEFGLTITKGNMIKRDLKSKSLLLWKEEENDDFRFHTSNIYVPKDQLIVRPTLANEDDWESKLIQTMLPELLYSTKDAMGIVGATEKQKRTVQRFLADLAKAGKIDKIKDGVFKLPS